MCPSLLIEIIYSCITLINTNLVNSASYKVDITIHYELICPHSRAIILEQAIPAWRRLSPIMNLDIIPYGNTKAVIYNYTTIPPQANFVCQHGKRECYGNTLMGCALTSLPKEYGFAFVECMFNYTTYMYPEKNGPECANKLSIDWNFLHSCYNSSYGKALQWLMGRRVYGLKPKHTLVPWILVEGKYSIDNEKRAFANMMELVCNTYKGYKPDICNETEIEEVNPTKFGFTSKSSSIPSIILSSNISILPNISLEYQNELRNSVPKLLIGFGLNDAKPEIHSHLHNETAKSSDIIHTTVTGIAIQKEVSNTSNFLYSQQTQVSTEFSTIPMIYSQTNEMSLSTVTVSEITTIKPYITESSIMNDERNRILITGFNPDSTQTILDNKSFYSTTTESSIQKDLYTTESLNSQQTNFSLKTKTKINTSTFTNTVNEKTPFVTIIMRITDKNLLISGNNPNLTQTTLKNTSTSSTTISTINSVTSNNTVILNNTIIMRNQTENNESIRNVNVSVYYASLCPFSRKYLMNQLIPTYFKLSSIMSLKLFPFGNCYINVINSNVTPPDAQFDCQHGLQEYIGNSIMSCALALQPFNTSLQYIDCIFKHKFWYRPKIAAQQCAEREKINWQSITDCYTTKKGSDIQYGIGTETRNIVPPHVYVPWITYENKHDKSVQSRSMKDMKAQVCIKYQGLKPQGCQ